MAQHIENSLILEDKRKRLSIIVNDEHIATAIYNPESPNTYKSLMNIFSLADGKKINPKEFKLTDEELEALDKELKTTEDFENDDKIFSKLNNAMQTMINNFDILEKEIDSIFGEGICNTILKYDSDGEYLAKLINIAFAETKKSRQKVKNKYKAQKQSDVME